MYIGTRSLEQKYVVLNLSPYIRSKVHFLCSEKGCIHLMTLAFEISNDVCSESKTRKKQTDLIADN